MESWRIEKNAFYAYLHQFGSYNLCVNAVQTFVLQKALCIQTAFSLAEHFSETQSIFLILEMSCSRIFLLNHLIMCHTRSVTGVMPTAQKETSFIPVVEVERFCPVHSFAKSIGNFLISIAGISSNIINNLRTIKN